MSGRRKADKPKSVLYYIGVGLSGGLFVFLILLGLLVVGIPAVTGSQALTVLTSSMEPKFPPGTLVVIKPIDVKDINLGDVITYQIESGKPAVVTHRVTGITTAGNGDLEFTTKGDNNDVADPKIVMPVQIQGKLWYAVPWIGYVANFVNGDARAWFVPLVAVILFLYAGFMIASGIFTAVRKRRAAKRDAEGAGDDADGASATGTDENAAETEPATVLPEGPVTHFSTFAPPEEIVRSGENAPRA